MTTGRQAFELSAMGLPCESSVAHRGPMPIPIWPLRRPWPPASTAFATASSRRQSLKGMFTVPKILPGYPERSTAAIHELETSSWARETFGDPVVDHYLHFFKTEQSKFDAVVTSWERKRYFERA